MRRGWSSCSTRASRGARASPASSIARWLPVPPPTPAPRAPRRGLTPLGRTPSASATEGHAAMPSGILLLDKPAGISSNAALQRVRRLFGRVKGGHVGSLDPLATGMLPICLGEATKVAGEILAGRKCYRFTVSLGSSTTTGDAEGTQLATAPVPALQAAAVSAVLQRFLGGSEQVPPMYSALKRAGQPLYRLARAGVSVERAPRRIELSQLQ